MTACVNSNQKREGARRAVGATLAGVLAVGMVPAAAFADEADAAEEGDDGIGALATSSLVDAINAGSVTAAKDSSDNAVADVKNIKVTYNGKDQAVTPTEITPKAGEAVKVDEKNFTVTQYKADADQESSTSSLIPGTKDVKGSAVAEVTDPGTYYAVVEGVTGTSYEGVAVALKYTVSPASLAEAFVYEVNADDAEDVTDTTFAYTGNAFNLGIALGDEALTVGTDYTVTYYVSGGSQATDGVKTPGDYVAVVEGQGNYDGSDVKISFTVDKLDLSALSLSLGDQVVGSTAAPAVAQLGLSDLSSDVQGALQLTFKSASNGDPILKDKGSYTYTLAVANDASQAMKGYIENSADVTFNVVETQLTTGFTYGDAEIAAATKNIDLSTAKDSDLFDASKVAVTTTDEDGEDVDVPFTIVVTDADGNAATVDDVNTPGTWNVTVKVDSASCDYQYGGSSATMTYNVTAGSVNAGSVFVLYDGKVTDSVIAYYDGEDVLGDIDYVISTTNGKVTLGEGDYELKVTNSKNKEVDAIVDAGTYTVKLTSKTYTFADDISFTVTVNALATDLVRVGNETVDLGADVIVWTGEAIEPVVEYVDLDASGITEKTRTVSDGENSWTEVYYENAKGDEVAYDDLPWAVLPADAYAIDKIQVWDADQSKFVKADEVKDAGYYQIAIKEAEDVINYDVSNASLYLTVANGKVFADVPVTEWYAKSVYDASSLGYINGYADGKFFGPNNSITRADVACVLFNMGGEALKADDFQYNEVTGYETGFADVNGKMYYAKAIAWAKELGIVNGYGDGTFDPDANITREEFAAMLANYAKVVGNYSAAGADALAGMPDAGAVSDWAEESVAWAVENGIMGNGGVINPQSNITRAEVAAMAVNYQPKRLTVNLVR